MELIFLFKINICLPVCLVTSVVSDSLKPHGLSVCPLPGSFAHRILQAKILEWVATPFSRGSS